VTAIAAACLSVEMILLTGLHVHFFGFQMVATNPAAWTSVFAVLAGIVAYGRFTLKPR
jgi:hypothetical protein